MGNSINTSINSNATSKINSFTMNQNNTKTYQAPSTINANSASKPEVLRNPATTGDNSQTTQISTDTKQEKKGLLSKVVDTTKKVAATGAVIVTDVGNATLKGAEKISDAVVWTGATVAQLGATGVGWITGSEKIKDWGKNVKQEAEKNIAVDVAGEVESLFYDTKLGQAIDNNSLMKHDSEASNKVKKGVLKIEEFAAATAATVLTGPAASILLGALYGTGGQAEKIYKQTENTTLAQEAGIAITGIAEGINWYAKGKMGEGLTKLAGVLKNGGGKVITSGIKSVFSTLKADGLKTTAAGIIKGAGGAIKNSALESLRDSAGIVADNVASWLTGEEKLFDENGKIIWKEVGSAAGELAATWALNVLTQSASDYLEGRLKVDVGNGNKPEVSEKVHAINEKYSSKNIVSKNQLADGITINVEITNNNINNIYDIMKNKYGEEQAKQALLEYARTGNIKTITRDGNAREIIKFIPQESINDYLRNMDYLDEIKKTMINEYGEQGLRGFDEFLKTGDSKYITRTDGMRNIATDISEDMREFYAKSVAKEASQNINKIDDELLKDTMAKYKQKMVLETSVEGPNVVVEKMESELDLLKKSGSSDVARVEALNNKIEKYKLAMQETDELEKIAKEKGFSSLGEWGGQKYEDVLKKLEKELGKAQAENNIEGIKDLNKTIDELKAKYDITSEMQAKADSLAKIYRGKAELAEAAITKDMRALETTNACLMGEDFRLKGEGSLSRKILSDTLEAKNDIGKPLTSTEINDIMDNAASKIGDSVRYTLVIDDADYVKKVNSSLNELKEKGYTLAKFGNTWGGDGYKGINTSLFAPDGTKMELQFHTAESYLVKEHLTHELYEVGRNDFVEQAFKDKANIIQKYYQNLISKPKGVTELTKSMFITE